MHPGLWVSRDLGLDFGGPGGADSGISQKAYVDYLCNNEERYISSDTSQAFNGVKDDVLREKARDEATAPTSACTPMPSRHRSRLPHARDRGAQLWFCQSTPPSWTVLLRLTTDLSATSCGR